MALTSTFIRYGGKEDGYLIYVSGQFVGSRKRHDDAEDLKRTEKAKLDRQLARMTAVRP